MLTIIQNAKMILCIPVAAFVMGCGTTATVSRIGAPAVNGTIVSSDARAIYVETQGETFPVDRQSISDIDHPGNVAAVIGGIVSAYGVANIAIGAPDCDRGGAAYCTGVFLPAAIGVPILAYGLVTWAGSRAAAKPHHVAEGANFAIVPTASFDKKNEYYGVSATVRY
jgi:hypothetical protein